MPLHDAAGTLVLASSRTEPRTREEAAAGTRPRLDYLEFADALGGDLLDTTVGDGQASWKRRVERALASDIRQAQVAWRRRGLYAAWLSTSERVGVPLALHGVGRRGAARPAHVLIGHIMDSRRKRQMQRLTGVFRWGFSDIICLATAQQDYLVNEAGVPPQRVHRLNDKVDTEFFRPPEQTEGDGEFVLAVGRENRDYQVLIEAARQLEMPVVIVASSLWAARGGVVAGEDDLPPNVTVRREFISYLALRDLYAAARLVVVPLHEASYAAGVNGLLEAMAMGRPVIATRTGGLADYLADPRTHRAVPPGDAAALAAAIAGLWGDAPGRRTMGRAARALAEEQMSLDNYVAGVTAIVRRAVEETE